VEPLKPSSVSRPGIAVRLFVDQPGSA
jgi:hypothetical protein